MGEKGEG
ncbi:hypothetical protein E2C01_096476 [Portunus trituberculatus]|nr:hypothetical protein [Portunus trituberculatus]